MESVEIVLPLGLELNWHLLRDPAERNIGLRAPQFLQRDLEALHERQATSGMGAILHPRSGGLPSPRFITRQSWQVIRPQKLRTYHKARRYQRSKYPSIFAVF